MDRYIKFSPGEYYHVYNRGVNKQKIFFSKDDWSYFQRLLFIRNDTERHIRPVRQKKKKLADIDIAKPLVDIQAYALMPNHFHLLLSEKEPGGITSYMRKLSTSYAMYINAKYGRSGPLMCRPFRAKHIDNDAYMRWVISYIHLNPISHIQSDWEVKGIQKNKEAHNYLIRYDYSSYRDYYGSDRDEGFIINKSSLPFFISDLEDPHQMFRTLNRVAKFS